MKPEIRNQGLKIRRSRSAFGMFLLTAALSLLLFPGAGSVEESPDDKVDNTRDMIRQWVETKRITSKERRDWALGREMLTDRIAVVKRRIESLKASIGDAEKSLTDTDKKRVGLIKENEKLKTASTVLSKTVVALEARTKKLLGWLPDPIRDRVKPLSQRLPDNPDETKLSLAERFQNIVGILNEVNKFNRDITVTSEVRTLRDGTTVEVAALYIGIGQAYYVSANGNAAGVGTASARGWIWKPVDEAAAEIARTIAILKNEQAAGFVQLPIRIK